MSHQFAISVEALTKTYGETRALDGLDLEVERGSVVAVLGPNGAGKTTLTRVLATLIRADGGRAQVAGYDVARHPQEVRRRIGVTGQSTSLDEYLSGRQNLVMVGQLCRLSSQIAKRRAAELLEQFELSAAADRQTRTYSGGMMRKLDLAASLMTQPEVLFLDEPTTGLDPRSRVGLWEVIRDLGRRGTSLLLSTQYLDEADQLAHRVAVVDLGRVIAWGTPDQLKSQVGGGVLEVTLGAGADCAEAARLLQPLAGGRATQEPRLNRVSLPASGERGQVTQVVRTLDGAAIEVDDVQVRRPALDDVFMTLTGHHAETDEEQAA